MSLSQVTRSQSGVRGEVVAIMGEGNNDCQVGAKSSKEGLTAATGSQGLAHTQSVAKSRPPGASGDQPR